jgi:hypothetical protein
MSVEKEAVRVSGGVDNMSRLFDESVVVRVSPLNKDELKSAVDITTSDSDECPAVDCISNLKLQAHGERHESSGGRLYDAEEDNDDNVSTEATFGDASSCTLSEVGSVQNIAPLDDGNATAGDEENQNLHCHYNGCEKVESEYSFTTDFNNHGPSKGADDNAVKFLSGDAAADKSSLTNVHLMKLNIPSCSDLTQQETGSGIELHSNKDCPVDILCSEMSVGDRTDSVVVDSRLLSDGCFNISSIRERNQSDVTCNPAAAELTRRSCSPLRLSPGVARRLNMQHINSQSVPPAVDSAEAVSELISKEQKEKRDKIAKMNALYKQQIDSLMLSMDEVNNKGTVCTF